MKIEDLCDKYGVKKIHLISKRRGKELIEAKKAIYQELRDAGLSYPEIGKLVNKHHTTILRVLKGKQ